MTALLAALLLSVQEPAEAASVEVARAIEAAIAGKDFEAADRQFDVDALLDRATKGSAAPEDFKKGFRTGLKRKFTWGKAILEGLKDGGRYKFIRSHEKDGLRRLLFRLTDTEGNVNYHDYAVASRGGAVKVIDVYTFLTGEFLSETYRRGMMASLAGQPGMLKSLMGAENEYVKALPRIQQMQKARQEGNAAEVLKIYAGLPPALRKEKTALVLRALAAVSVGEKEAREALEDFKKAYPGDPAVDFMSIDALFLGKQYGKAAEAVERVDQSVGGDAFLAYLKGSVLLTDGKVDLAREAAGKAVERERSLAEPYWLLITIALREKKWADTVKWLHGVEKEAGVELTDLTGADDYAEFVKTAEYKAWMDSRR